MSMEWVQRKRSYLLLWVAAHCVTAEVPQSQEYLSFPLSIPPYLNFSLSALSFALSLFLFLTLISHDHCVTVVIKSDIKLCYNPLGCLLLTQGCVCFHARVCLCESDTLLNVDLQSCTFMRDGSGWRQLISWCIKHADTGP